MSTLHKTYDPKEVEPGVAALWEQQHCFHATPDDRGPDRRFCIVIPPPNVTGALHLGHALNNTLQDILVRRRRMQGWNTLWIPGTDHAGIATQAVVERRLFEEHGQTRHDIGREALVRRIWAWKDDYEARIIRQLKLMGCSCDFERTRFTLDEGCSRAVRYTFFRLFRDGHIFRGKRLVNWDCELQTAVADDEVYHETVQGKFYHFRYPIKDAAALGIDPGHVVIATTRPETLLGDTAVAVNPADPRYTHLVGRTVLLPLMNRPIPIIADEWANPELGSGCVKITPAHDANDHEVGRRHGLPLLNVLNPDGTINAEGGRYAGLPRFEARTAVLRDLEALGLIEKIEDHEHDVGHSDRSRTPIEPYLSDQWFLRMQELAEPTLAAVRHGDVTFHPDRYKHAYLDWLGERRDWCISRQLWWGHRLPVWSLAGTWGAFDPGALHFLADHDRAAVQRVRTADGDTRVLPAGGPWDDPTLNPGDAVTLHVCLRDDDPADVARLEQLGFAREVDVLDTWFSSALWPHSTLGWPERTPELDYYYPTSVLITSRDIITLWVVRMVLTGLYNLGQKPFHDVYVHPKILDGRGVTMSKSKGNGVDPLDIIEAFGADALRFGIAIMTTETQDIRMPVEYRCPHCAQGTPQTPANMFGADGNPSRVLACQHCAREFATRWADDRTRGDQGLALMVSDKFEAARNFINKLWNAARFAFMNLDGAAPQRLNPADLPPEDRWILAELSAVIRAVNRALEQYQFSRATTAVREFFWTSLCDWYLEIVKYRIAEDHAPAAARQVLAVCLDQVLRLLHPIVPFVTEQLWQSLNQAAPQRGLPGVLEVGDIAAVLTVAAFPPAGGHPAVDDPLICETFHDLRAVARTLREIRNAANVPPRQGLTVTIKTDAARAARLGHEAHILKRMAGIEQLALSETATRPPGSAIRIVAALQIFVHDVVDDARERARVEKDIAGLTRQLNGLSGKLNNAGYLRSAPPDTVAETRRLQADAQATLHTLQEILKLLAA